MSCWHVDKGRVCLGDAHGDFIADEPPRAWERKVLIAKHGNAVYSDGYAATRQRAYRTRARREAVHACTCQVCGCTFETHKKAPKRCPECIARAPKLDVARQRQKEKRC